MVIGELDRVARPRTARFVDAFAAVGVEARVSENIGLDLWRKLSFIVPMNVASGLTRGPVGEMLSTERGRALLSGVVAEIAAVSRVAGTALDEAEEARIRKDVLALPYSTTPSFLADLVRGGPTELDMLVGAVSRMGNEHGVPTPIHDFATTAFEAATAPKQA
jgi:2-dehydropantoate 2-reductase